MFGLPFHYIVKSDSEESPSALLYEMVGDLEKILAETQLPGAVSVLEKSGRKLYTKFTPDTYEPEEAEAIRTALGQYHPPEPYDQAAPEQAEFMFHIASPIVL